ncbi:MAG: DUF1573 domain-containing protein [Niabella sp.]
MKKNILFALAFVLIAAMACNDGKDKKAEGPQLTEEQKQLALKDSANGTTIQWLDSTYQNVGKVKKGQSVEISFRFKNTGDKPLIIAAVLPGCGCTVAEKPETPILPGKEDKIVAKFNSESQSVGSHQKNVTVQANTQPMPTTVLTFNVDVVE